ncbi:hypothetical protein ACFIJ5_17655 [Haloimpatiens sp. FM7330]|uniref:hypothetical protein n=1 Tax=Haloimpatiens sp. FM7330 TaxID=3298610 RepID=UPI0036378B92
MLKLIKYEIKGNYDKFIFIFAIMTILNLFFLSRIGSWRDYEVQKCMDFVYFGSVIAVLIFSIKSYSEAMYGQEGYLTFTIPLKSVDILNVKFIVTLFWFCISVILIYVFEKIKNNLLLEKDWLCNVTKDMSLSVKLSFIFVIFIVLCTLLILIYLSITTTKIAIKNRNINKFVGFIIFLGLLILIGAVDIYILQKFNKSIIINNGLDFNGYTNSIGLGYKEEALKVSYDLHTHMGKLNIASAIYSVLVFIGLYTSTAYLIRNKLDL